jgi:glycerol-3-phosphate dehydrogenase
MRNEFGEDFDYNSDAILSSWSGIRPLVKELEEKDTKHEEK